MPIAFAPFFLPLMQGGKPSTGTEWKDVSPLQIEAVDHREMSFNSSHAQMQLCSFLLQSDKPNLARPERELGLRYGRLRGPVHGRKGHSNIASQSKALNPIQERALRSCVISVHRAYCLSYSDITERAANRLLERAGSDRLVAHNWTSLALCRCWSTAKSWRFVNGGENVRNAVQKIS
ncbi:hypothetical protein PCH_Pc01g00040 [Penicillium rubens Wisconsin 54-1255]|uniref:Uncharacterized protein n=1 Tax=Penicillium rubens (strain ATCC 28089 / DSM 1075 / NRRL 1951 / Wisconsin 54-1255) TaxID=500485 RepID=B6GVP8_PENRW|nr:hypothetical protein PCH_Pc01g00040 [Penicillium rubens Wisconsin 54-1255]